MMIPAVFAMGCFWCGEADFEKAGCPTAASGYAGGSVANPMYMDVVYGGTGHLEVVRLMYNPEAALMGTSSSTISNVSPSNSSATSSSDTKTGTSTTTSPAAFDVLLFRFWINVDPFDASGQFCDKGDSYRAAIFVHPEYPEQRARAERSLAIVADVFRKLPANRRPTVMVSSVEPYGHGHGHDNFQSGYQPAPSEQAWSAQIANLAAGRIVPIVDLPARSQNSNTSKFWLAEDYHQDFHTSCKQACLGKYGGCCKDRYAGYRIGCGRDLRLQEVWRTTRAQELLGESLLGVALAPTRTTWTQYAEDLSWVCEEGAQEGPTPSSRDAAASRDDGVGEDRTTGAPSDASSAHGRGSWFFCAWGGSKNHGSFTANLVILSWTVAVVDIFWP